MTGGRVVSANRLITLWCPEWPLVAAGVAPDRPAIVLDRNRVVARTPSAAVAGVRHGQRRRTAQSMSPAALIVDLATDRDARAFAPVVDAVTQLAPRVDVVAPGWMCLPARGPSRYFGGDEACAALLVDTVRTAIDRQIGDGAAAGYGVGIGVADGRAASTIAARRAAATPSGIRVVAPGASAADLAPLSIEWLRELGEVAPETADVLVRLGLRTFADVARVDGGDMLARFGLEGRRARAIAVGDDTALPDLSVPDEIAQVEHHAEPALAQVDTVVFVAKRLADELAASLAADGRVCQRLVVVVETEHGERSERSWYRDQGLSAAAMVERVRWQVEGWNVSGLTGGVALVRLVAERITADDGVQDGFWGGRSRADDAAARAIVRLVGLAGDTGVRVPAWEGGRLPAERYRWVPAVNVDLADASGRLDRGDGPWPGSLPPPSPAVVASEPVAADVLADDGTPVAVSGRGELSAPPATLRVDGRPSRIVRWAGPWPIEQRWWSSERARRIARLQLVLDDDRALLVALEGGAWSVLATYG